MRILLSNDDGYYSKGITGLAESLKQFAEVTIVAPENNCSGSSSSLTLKNPLRIRKFQDNGYYVNGTPADCVFLALTKVLDTKPDLLVSGINHGANLGDDVFNGFSIQGVNKDDYDMLMLAQTKRPTDKKVYDAKEIKKDFSRRKVKSDAIITKNKNIARGCGVVMRRKETFYA